MGARLRLRYRPLGFATHPRFDSSPIRCRIPSAFARSQVARPGLESASASAAGARARRRTGRGVAQTRLATDQKKARRLNAQIVFIDETGFSFLSRLAPTWAPVGKTPMLRRVSRRR